MLALVAYNEATHERGHCCIIIEVIELRHNEDNYLCAPLSFEELKDNDIVKFWLAVPTTFIIIIANAWKGL